MPKEFWEWYSRQNFILSAEELWDHPDKKYFLLGIMIAFLLNKGTTINTPRPFTNYEELSKWIYTGICWLSEE